MMAISVVDMDFIGWDINLVGVKCQVGIIYYFWFLVRSASNTFTQFTNTG